MLRAASADADAVRMTKAADPRGGRGDRWPGRPARGAHPKLRTRFYEEIGLHAVYDPHEKVVEATAGLGVRIASVGGGT